MNRRICRLRMCKRIRQVGGVVWAARGQLTVLAIQLQAARAAWSGTHCGLPRLISQQRQLTKVVASPIAHRMLARCDLRDRCALLQQDCACAKGYSSVTVWFGQRAGNSHIA